MLTNKQLSMGFLFMACLLIMSSTVGAQTTDTFTYPIVDTNQTYCFSDAQVIACGNSFDGQDAQYAGLQPAYSNNGDGTVTDLNTGLMWIQDAGEKTTYAEAMQLLETYTFAGYDDWRLPTIKELYSLALFSGVDASAASTGNEVGLVPFIDTDYFVFQYGLESGGTRVIDSQWLTSTIYGSEVMNGQSCFFGFNFSDGRIKCYGLEARGPSGGYFAQFVRGNDAYGQNDFVNNNDGTISDQATGLTWTQNDSGIGMMWADSLAYCESLNLGNYDDWRLPNIKELHSIVDYSRLPDATNSPAIDPIFNVSEITNEVGQLDYPFYWSSTTLISYPNNIGSATYISFGRALGYVEEFGGWVDVHGAGAQRSDPKSGDPTAFPTGFGPQGDAIRINNYVRCVRGGVADVAFGSDPSTWSLTGGNVPNNDGGSQNTQGQEQGGPDLDAAAQQLGVTVQQLRDALGAPPPDLQAAAQQLGVTVQQLEQALGLR